MKKLTRLIAVAAVLTMTVPVFSACSTAEQTENSAVSEIGESQSEVTSPDTPSAAQSSPKTEKSVSEASDVKSSVPAGSPSASERDKILESGGSSEEATLAEKFSLRELMEASETQEQLESITDTYSNELYTTDIQYDDGTVTVVIQYREQLNLDDAQKENIKNLLEQQIENYQPLLGTMDTSDVKLVVKVLNADGSVIYERVLTETNSSSSSDSAAASEDGRFKTLEDLLNHSSDTIDIDRAIGSGTGDVTDTKITVENGNRLVYTVTLQSDSDDTRKKSINAALDEYEPAMKFFITTLEKQVAQNDISLVIRYNDSSGNRIAEKEYK